VLPASATRVPPGMFPGSGPVASEGGGDDARTYSEVGARGVPHVPLELLGIIPGSGSGGTVVGPETRDGALSEASHRAAGGRSEEGCSPPR